MSRKWGEQGVRSGTTSDKWLF